MHPFGHVPVAPVESHLHKAAPAPSGFPRAEGPTRFPIPRREREIIYRKKLLDPAIDLHPDVSATLVVSLHGATHACYREGSPAHAFIYTPIATLPTVPSTPSCTCTGLSGDSKKVGRLVHMSGGCGLTWHSERTVTTVGVSGNDMKLLHHR